MHIAEQKDKWECVTHTHEFLELGYIYKGTGSYHIDGVDYIAQMGDIFIIPPNVSHFEINNPECPFQINFLMVKFNSENLEYILDMIKSLQGKIHIEQMHKVKVIFDDITDEVIIQNPGYLSSIDAKLKSLIILLYRQAHLSVNEAHRTIASINTPEMNKDLIEKIELYLYEHIDEKCSIESLAQQFFYHPKHLSKIFQKEKGLMLSEYIQKMRNDKAKEMLKETDTAINEISEKLGYSSVSHFYKSFKKETGKTPFIYRQQYLSVPCDPFPAANQAR